MPSSRVSISQHRDTSVVIYLCVIYLLATFCRQPTLRSESRDCLQAMPSREEEKLPLWWIKKVAQKPRGDNFRGHPIKFSKTDAFALLLREKVSVF